MAEHVGGIGVIQERKIPAGGIDHEHPEDHQGEDHQQQNHVHIQLEVRPFLALAPRAATLEWSMFFLYLFQILEIVQCLLTHSCFTSSRKRSPRASKSVNSSKLVPPGDRRTTSPDWATLAALRTACAKFAAWLSGSLGATR